MKWDNLEIEEVRYGFGWRKYREEGTDIIENILDDLDTRFGKLKLQIEKMKNCNNCFHYPRYTPAGMNGVCQECTENNFKNWRMKNEN